MLALRRSALFITLFGLYGCAPDTFSSSDGGADATPSDGSSSDAGAPDAIAFEGGPGEGGSGDGGALDCSNLLSGTVLCDDFDEDGGSISQKWTGQLNANGTNAFDSNVFRSSPRSYRASTNANDSGAAFADAALLVQSQQLLPPTTTLTAAAFVRVHNVDSNASTPILKISYASTTGGMMFASILLEGGKLVLEVEPDSSVPTSTDNLGNITLDAWVYVQVDVTLKPDHITASLDGVPVKSFTPQTLGLPSATPLPQVMLGILEGTTTFATVVNFDNFVFRIH